MYTNSLLSVKSDQTFLVVSWNQSHFQFLWWNMYTESYHISFICQLNIFQNFKDHLLILNWNSTYIILSILSNYFYWKINFKSRKSNLYQILLCNPINFKIFQTNFAAITRKSYIVIFPYFVCFYFKMMESKYEQNQIF